MGVVGSNPIVPTRIRGTTGVSGELQLFFFVWPPAIVFNFVAIPFPSKTLFQVAFWIAVQAT